MMKKMLISIGLLAVLLTGCGKTDIVKTYEKSENAGISATYYVIAFSKHKNRTMYFDFGHKH